MTGRPRRTPAERRWRCALGFLGVATGSVLWRLAVVVFGLHSGGSAPSRGHSRSDVYGLIDALLIAIVALVVAVWLWPRRDPRESPQDLRKDMA